MNNKIVQQQIKFLNKYHHLHHIKQLKRKFIFFFYIYIFVLLFSHTKELLDEALDSVKNVLMQTFKKNLESGGDLKYIINLSKKKALK
jgi:hypothetical protein